MYLRVGRRGFGIIQAVSQQVDGRSRAAGRVTSLVGFRRLRVMVRTAMAATKGVMQQSQREDKGQRRKRRA